jgi:hypothetical protein
MLEAVGAAITTVIKVGVPIYVAVLIGSFAALFLPDPIVQQIGIAAFRQSYRGYLGGALIAAASLLLAHLLSATSRAVTNRFDDRRLRRMTIETLRMLTEDEKKFLRPFIFNGENTISAPINDGISGGLLEKQIIYRASSIIKYFNAPYNLQPIVRKLLSKDPALLD